MLCSLFDHIAWFYQGTKALCGNKGWIGLQVIISAAIVAFSIGIEFAYCCHTVYNSYGVQMVKCIDVNRR
jgi:hypothetical protein